MKKAIYILFLLALGTSAYCGEIDKNKSSARMVSGTVTDTNGDSVPGAKITIVETGETVFADLNGNFKIAIADKAYSISVNNIGFAPLKVASSQLSPVSVIKLTSF